jgi:hypothetical protein
METDIRSYRHEISKHLAIGVVPSWITLSRLGRSLSIVWLLCSLLSIPTFGQGGNSSPPASHSKPVTLPILYRHFLAYQSHLDRLATALDKQGKDGSGFRNHFQHELNFSDTEYAAVRATALRLEAELKEQDTKAKAIIDATRARYPKELRSTTTLPPVSPELVQLQKERDAMIEHEIENLKTAIGPKQASKLDAFLQTQFAPNVKVQNITLPPLNDAAQHRMPPFKPEVQP